MERIKICPKCKTNPCKRYGKQNRFMPYCDACRLSNDRVKSDIKRQQKNKPSFWRKPEHLLTDEEKTKQREHRQAYLQQYHKDHPKDNKEYMKRYNKKYRAENLEEVRRSKRNYARNLKLEGIKEYGGKCTCCGESTPEFLTIEHINGRQRGEKRLTGTKMWMKLKSLNWPKDEITVLCFNCNCAKGAFGKCPHQQSDE